MKLFFSNVYIFVVSTFLVDYVIIKRCRNWKLEIQESPNFQFQVSLYNHTPVCQNLLVMDVSFDYVFIKSVLGYSIIPTFHYSSVLLPLKYSHPILIIVY